WFESLEENLQDEILAVVGLLEREGPNLSRPRADTLEDSKYPNMKELRVQFRGEPWRILFAFDPQRKAILLLGGNKAGKPQWYKENIPIADKRYKKHLELLKQKMESKNGNTRRKNVSAAKGKKRKNRKKN
ncbi:MAG: type II toxin-antitoxin system RelE/ParE family toxin, partial [Waterburya sp.]